METWKTLILFSCLNPPSGNDVLTTTALGEDIQRGGRIPEATNYPEAC